MLGPVEEPADLPLRIRVAVSQERARIVDYLGTHQHLAVDLELSVDERGGLRLRSGAGGRAH